MGLLARLFGPRYRPVDDPRHLRTGQRVELRGRAETQEPLDDPVDHVACVAMEYRAWPPATTVGMDGGMAHGSRAFQIHAMQAVSFDLHVDRQVVRVEVDPGEDVAARHRELLQRYGVTLRTEVVCVEVGRQVVVHGVVRSGFEVGTSPLRREPTVAVVRADRFWAPD